MTPRTLVLVTASVTAVPTALVLVAAEHPYLAVWAVLVAVLVFTGYLIGKRFARIGRSVARGGRKVRAVWRHADTLVES